MINYILLSIILLGCSSNKEATLYYSSKNVLDIELPANNVRAFCSFPGDPKKRNYFIKLYLFHDEKIDLAFYPHVVSKKVCKKNIEVLTNLINKSKKIRILGTTRLESAKDSELPRHMKNEKLNHVDNSWILSRVISDKGCEDFLCGCSEPINAERKMYGED